jgi:hypothetical protein
MFNKINLEIIFLDSQPITAYNSNNMLILKNFQQFLPFVGRLFVCFNKIYHL